MRPPMKRPSGPGEHGLPGDAAVRLELDHRVGHGVGHAHLHGHAERRAECQALRRAVLGLDHGARAVDLGVARGVGHHGEDGGGRGLDDPVDADDVCSLPWCDLRCTGRRSGPRLDGVGDQVAELHPFQAWRRGSRPARPAAPRRPRTPPASAGAHRHHWSPGWRPAKPNSGCGVERSLPTDAEKARNSAVTRVQTVWTPTSSAPVLQQPSR